MRSKRTSKILIEFDTPQGALRWFDGVKAEGGFPDDVDLYEADGLDVTRGADGAYIVKRIGDRPWGRLRDKFGSRI
jgi:hypothetical protein